MPPDLSLSCSRPNIQLPKPSTRAGNLGLLAHKTATLTNSVENCSRACPLLPGHGVIRESIVNNAPASVRKSSRAMEVAVWKSIHVPGGMDQGICVSSAFSAPLDSQQLMGSLKADKGYHRGPDEIMIRMTHVLLKVKMIKRRKIN